MTGKDVKYTKITFNNHYGNRNNTTKKQEFNVNIGNGWSIMNYDDTKDFPNKVGQMKLSIFNNQKEYIKEGKTVCNDNEIEMNPTKFEIFKQIVNMFDEDGEKGSKNYLSEEDLIKAREDFKNNEEKWNKRNVKQIKLDRTAGIATIIINNPSGEEEILRFKFTPQKTSKKEKEEEKNSEKRYIISDQTETMEITEEYRGRGYYAIATDLYKKYKHKNPNFDVPKLLEKITEINNNKTLQVGQNINIPVIIEEEIAYENNEIYDDTGVNAYKQLIYSGMETETKKLNNNLQITLFKYKVKRGETLYNIGRKYDVDIKTIKSFNNNIKANGSLSEGQIIKIPKVVYNVKRGDNLNSIAKYTGINQELLASINDINSPDEIKTNSKIALPATIYTVKQGDTLTKIYKELGFNDNDIELFNKINNLNKNSIITVGSPLVIIQKNIYYSLSTDDNNNNNSNNITTDTKTENKTVQTGNRTQKKVEGHPDTLTWDTDKQGNTIETRLVYPPAKNNSGKLKGKTIIINAGHGFKRGTSSPDVGTPGMGGAEDEYLITHKLALELKDQLNSLGAKVIIIQGAEGNASQGKNLASKGINKPENNGASCVISLHINSSSAPPDEDRAEIFYSQANKGGKLLAETLIESLGMDEKNCKNGNYQLLKKSKYPTIIYEAAFMNHEDGQKFLKNENAKKQRMKQLSNAVAEYIEIMDEKEKNNIKYTVQQNDTLGKIAKKYKTTTDTIKKVNDLKTDTINVGMVLYIPKEKK